MFLTQTMTVMSLAMTQIWSWEKAPPLSLMNAFVYFQVLLKYKQNQTLMYSYVIENNEAPQSQEVVHTAINDECASSTKKKCTVPATKNKDRKFTVPNKKFSGCHVPPFKPKTMGPIENTNYSAEICLTLYPKSLRVITLDMLNMYATQKEKST